VRIEDLDLARVRSGAADAVLHALDWLGINFDEGPYVQSTDLEPHRGAMRILTDLSPADPCSLTRNEFRQAPPAICRWCSMNTADASRNAIISLTLTHIEPAAFALSESSASWRSGAAPVQPAWR